MTTTTARAARMVMITASCEEQAVSIAHALVDERLAACVNVVGPIRSIYSWQGKVADEAEHLMLVKTRASLVKKLERRVRELHSYDVPEVIVLPLVGGSAPYLKWMMQATAPKPGRKSRTRAKIPASKA